MTPAAVENPLRPPDGSYLPVTGKTKKPPFYHVKGGVPEQNQYHEACDDKRCVF